MARAERAEVHAFTRWMQDANVNLQLSSSLKPHLRANKYIEITVICYVSFVTLCDTFGLTAREDCGLANINLSYRHIDISTNKGDTHYSILQNEPEGPGAK